MKNKFVIMFIISTSLFACYNNETLNDYVTIRSTNSNLYELDLISKNVGRGNLHTLDISKYAYEEHLWLYFDSLNGKIEADDIIWTIEKGKLYSPWKKEKIQGFIRIDSQKIQINLYYPYYKDGVNLDGWEEFEKNGEYRVILKLDSISEVNHVSNRSK